MGVTETDILYAILWVLAFSNIAAWAIAIVGLFIVHSMKKLKRYPARAKVEDGMVIMPIVCPECGGMFS